MIGSGGFVRKQVGKLTKKRRKNKNAQTEPRSVVGSAGMGKKKE